ncbi:hypothetical protein [Paludibaculum fermentans]|uniref:hypothetical protein n=1 Tax=Paludibaculum fermentans TaxID=1473598 RepID=UPI003EB88F52
MAAPGWGAWAGVLVRAGFEVGRRGSDDDFDELSAGCLYRAGKNWQILVSFNSRGKMDSQIGRGLLLAGVLVAFAPHFEAKGEKRKVVTVCQLLAAAEELDGRIVSVRGILKTSSDEAGAPYFDQLTGGACAGRAVADRTLQVVSPDAHFLAKPPSGYKPDEGSFRRAGRLLDKMLAAGQPVGGFDATVEGIFYRGRSQPRLPVRHRQYPGYVVIQAIRNVKALP